MRESGSGPAWGRKQDGKNTLLLFADTWIDAAAYFNDAELGILLRATLLYFQSGAITDFEDRAQKMKYSEVIRQLEYSDATYKQGRLKKMYGAYKTQVTARNERTAKTNPNASPEPIFGYDVWYEEIYLPLHSEDTAT